MVGRFRYDRLVERPRDFRAGGIATTARAGRILSYYNQRRRLRGKKKIVTKSDGKPIGT
jgi:hypothetical protein